MSHSLGPPQSPPSPAPPPEIAVHIQQNPQRVPRTHLRNVLPLRGQRALSRRRRRPAPWVLVTRTANQPQVQPYRVSKPDLLARTATNPGISVSDRPKSHLPPITTYLLQVLVRDQREPELRTAPDNTRRSALEECLEALFTV